MKIRTCVTIHHTATKVLTVAIAAAMLGMMAGIVTVYAETRTNRLVTCVGKVATAATDGWSSGGTLYAFGDSTSTVTLSDIIAHVRFWHQSTGGNILQDEDRRDFPNSTGGATDPITTVGYGDKAATLSFFKPSCSAGNTYYTSWPDYSGSCYKFWATGNSC